MHKTKPKIVIVGAGFGGLYTYLQLHRKFHKSRTCPELTLVNKENYFLFTPLLHEVATGSVNQSNIIQPIRQILDGCVRFLLATALEVDPQKKILKTSSCEVPYDYLILALGSGTNYRDFPKDHVLALKTIADARALKNQIISNFEKANESPDPQLRKKLLTFPIIGGGATGVELAAEISEFTGRTMLKLYPEIKPEEVSVHLIHAQAELIPQFSPILRQKSLRQLRDHKNIIVHLNATVEQVDDTGITISGGTRIASACPILTAGVRPNPIQFSQDVQKNSAGQLIVNQFLQLPAYPEIFALGDMAAPENGQVPQTAQAAEAEAAVVAHNLCQLISERKQPLQSFVFRERGQLISLGFGKAAAQIGKVRIFGGLAWWIWRTNYAGKLIGFANKLRVVLDWTIDLFYPRDVSKL